MKKIFTLVLLALLLICGLPVSAQFYETQWEKVNTHLLDRQPVSASKVLDTIESHALEANDQMQLLNAMLYRRKIMLLTVENEPQEAFIRYAEAKIDVLDTIPAAILHVEIGRCYAELLNMYKSKIKNNVDMAGDLSKTEMRYWGQENFKEAIGQHLDAALQAIGKLKQARTRDYLMLFEEEVRPDVQYLDYEPTLFEFVFHRAANIYKELAKVDDVPQAWKLDDWWLPAENFVGLDLGESDSPSLRYLKIFQELIAYTSEIGDETTLIYNDFCRLRFVNTLLQDENAYQKALMQLMEQHAEQPLTADIALELVNSMLKNASPYDAAPEAGNYERATQLCHEVVAKFPETKASDDIINILDELYKTELQITLSRVQLPDENIPVVLNYRNLRHAYLKVVKVSEEEWIQQLYQRWYDNKFLQSLRTQPAYAEQRVHLPAETDMLWHSTMVALQPLEKGFYYLIVMPDRNTLDNDQVSFYGFQVSRLGFITDEKNTIYTIDRKTGQPVGEVTVEHCQRSYNRKTKCNETRVLSKSKSDKDGKVSIRRSTNNFFYANLRKDGDVLLSMPDDYLDFSTGHGFYFTVNTAYYNATLFTDRSIYRPGQTVYYHGIIVKKKGQKESLCKHHSETVYFYDGNSQFIEEQKIRTDEYGSFSGSFVIPNDRLNGTFCIELGSRYTYNSPSDRVYFKVEEYKRPTFEVKFDQPKEQYKVNQEITLNGSVKAFAGFGLDGIECRYQVKRKTSFPWRRYGQTYPTVKDEQMTFGTTKTDNEGKFAIIFNLTPSAKVKPELQPVFTYEIEVTATSAQGETHSETFSVRAGYNEIALSSNLGALVDKSVDAKVHVEAINMSGEPAKSRVMQRIYRYDNAARIDYFEAMQSNITLDRQIYSDMELAKMFPNYDFYLKDDKILVSENEFMLEGEKDLETLSNLGPGRYLLELKSLDDPLAECSNCFVLVDSRTTKMPVTAMQWLQADKAVAHPDDTIHFVLGSSAKEVNAWVKLYHDGKEVLMDQWVEINQGMVNLPYVVTEKDRGMLTFTVAFAKENSFQTIAQRVFVPYDNLDLKVELASVRDKLTPGSEETWEFTVRDNQGQPVKSALLANMYDVSLDELEPEEWKAFNMTPSCYSAYGFTTYPVGSLYKPYLPNLKTFKITLFNFTLPSDAPFFDAAVVRSYTKSSSYNTWSVYSKGPNGRLKGKITDETGETVPFANIIIEKKGVQCGGASSDFDGNYDINPISPGTYDLKASCIGLNPFVLHGLVIPANKITFYNIKMASGAINLNEVTVVDYEIPLISADNTTQGASITAEEIAKLPNRSAEGVAASVGGVFSQDGEVGSIRGSREGAVYYIDGVKVIGSANVPQGAIDQVDVILGGTPAMYGDAMGGIINMTTKGPSRTWGGGLEVEYSVEGYGHGRLGGNLQGPLIKSKKNDQEALLGFFLAFDLNRKKYGYTSAVPYYRATDEWQDYIEKNPLTLSGYGTGANLTASYTHSDNLVATRFLNNTTNGSINVIGNINVRTSKTTNLTIGGSIDRESGHYPDSRKHYFFNTDKNYLLKEGTYRGYVRFTQRFPSDPESTSLISNVYYSVQADYSRHSYQYGDPDLWNNLFAYGNLGKFTTYKDIHYSYLPSIDSVQIDGSNNLMTLNNVWVMDNYYDTLVEFQASGFNPLLSQYVDNYFDLYESYGAAGYYDNFDNIQLHNGLINGVSPSVAYLYYVPGSVQNGYTKSVNDQISINVNGSMTLGRGDNSHEIKLGFQYEQQNNAAISYYENYWTLMQGMTNFHIRELDVDHPYATSYDGYVDTVKFHRLYDATTQYTFDYRLRQAMNLPVNGTEFILIDSYDFNDNSIMYYDENGKLKKGVVNGGLDLSMFAADEVVRDGNTYVYYYGYTYDGDRKYGLTERPSLSDFFNATDEDNIFTRPIGAQQPIYMAGYIQDKFAFKDLIFNIGVRVDRFDANQDVLKDPYVLYDFNTVGDLMQNGRKIQMEDQSWAEVPENIGNDYVVYVNKISEKTAIVGYRNGNTWYNQDGREISDPTVLDMGTGVSPWIKNKDQQRVDMNSFKDYDPAWSIMPRISFSFPISDEALFFAHYDVLTQRPSSSFYCSPLYYYHFNDISQTIANPNLKPAQTIEYELGFTQKVTNTSSLTISGYYHELRNMIQMYRFNGAYPKSYNSFSNLDFGTVKGLTASYDMRRTKNARIRASYTLQFANMTGSSTSTASALISAGVPNLRSTFPTNADRRHAFNLSLDYRYSEGKNYDGPVVHRKNGKPDLQILSNTGFSLEVKGGSGTPFTASRKVNSPIGQANNLLKGTYNGSRIPASFRFDLRVDKDFSVNIGRKKEGESQGRDASVNVYLIVQNLLNSKNITNVYSATGNPDDDGYLSAPEWQREINTQIDPQAYAQMYQLYVNSGGNYSMPRHIKVGMSINF